MTALILIFAFLAGLIFRKLGYPPLLGYLLAGFACHFLGIGSSELLSPIADLGVTMLLFTIGLKLRSSELVKPYVCGPALLHMIIVIPLTAAVIMMSGSVVPALSFDSALAPWLLAFALSFSSTVFAIKMFDERGENASFYASIAIGILVIQDILAVLFLVVMSKQWPSMWAVVLLVIPFTYRLWQPRISQFLRIVGHGELQLLFGFVAALGAYEAFELLHLKGGLGALLAGVAIGSSDNKRSKELYNRLSALKNLFLIGFFLQIGFYGMPSFSMLLISIALTALILLRPLIYFSLFTLFRLRARTAWLSGIGLFTYSEFGLIVAAIAVSGGYIHQDWMVTLALAIAMSFFLSTPVNKQAHQMYRRYANKLIDYEKGPRLEAEVIEKLGDSRVVVLGMGRVGAGAYDFLSKQYPCEVIGVEENFERTIEHKANGLKCVHGDASDRFFWDQTELCKRDMILVSLSNHRENLSVVSLAKELGFDNTLAATARFEDEKIELESIGCVSFNVYSDVGKGFAEHVMESLPEVSKVKA